MLTLRRSRISRTSSSAVMDAGICSHPRDQPGPNASPQSPVIEAPNPFLPGSTEPQDAQRQYLGILIHLRVAQPGPTAPTLTCCSVSSFFSSRYTVQMKSPACCRRDEAQREAWGAMPAASTANPNPGLHLGPTGSACYSHLHNGSDFLPLLPQLLLVHLGRARGSVPSERLSLAHPSLALSSGWDAH